MECELGGATVSFWPPTINTGLVTLLQFVVVCHGASGKPALTVPVVSLARASSVPPPPMDQPDTPRRVPSVLSRTAVGAVLTAQFSAASSWSPRESGKSKGVLVLTPTTTKPHEETRGPSQLMAFQSERKPG